ncbi:hypothetical protein VU05_01505 [Desulfobulbus sp. F1]|nr:hypothetical protein [Desulfobulbus sp. F1]
MDNIVYSPHGGIHKVALVYCPAICGNRIVHLSQDGQSSWIIRDYIIGQQLRHSPNNSFSNLSLREIEAKIDFFMKPPFRSYKDRSFWENHLKLLTTEIDTTTKPNQEFGTWRNMKQ